MQTRNEAVRPRAYWWIAVLALAWNLIGLAMFFIQVTLDGEQLMKLTEAQRAVHLATPVAAAAEQLYLLGEAQGKEAVDDSAVITVLAPAAAVKEI